MDALVNLGELSKPATVLIERVCDAIGGIFRPWQTRRIARAEADAYEIKVLKELKVNELQQRAFDRLIQEEEMKQQNMENITKIAIGELKEEAHPEGIEKDWLINFFDKGRLISDGQMQDLWARILAGQANAPGKYSKRTVNLLASLDKEDADFFTSLCSFTWLIREHLFPLIYDFHSEIYKKAGVNFERMNHLDDIGIVSFEPRSTAAYCTGVLPQKITAYYQSEPVYSSFQSKTNVLNAGKVLFSKVGEELATVCTSQPVPGFKEYVIDRWRGGGCTVEEASAKRTSGEGGDAP
jgi:hypothetical protein